MDRLIIFKESGSILIYNRLHISKYNPQIGKLFVAWILGELPPGRSVFLAQDPPLPSSRLLMAAPTASHEMRTHRDRALILCQALV